MKNSRGFSLIEVLVALGLLAVAMLFIAPLFTGGLRSNAVGWDYSVLNSLAKQKLEEVLQYNFLDPRLAVPNGATVTIDDPTQPGASKSITVNGQLYTNESSLTQSVGGMTSTYPYKTVYVVQDFLLTSIPLPGSTPNYPDPTQAQWDPTQPPAGQPYPTPAVGVWSPYRDVKLVTVYGLSIRKLQGDYTMADVSSLKTTGSPYLVQMFQLQPGELPAKQIRMSAIKSP